MSGLLGEGYYCFDCGKFVPKEVHHDESHTMGKYTLIKGWLSEKAEAASGQQGAGSK